MKDPRALVGTLMSPAISYRNPGCAPCCEDCGPRAQLECEADSLTCRVVDEGNAFVEVAVQTASAIGRIHDEEKREAIAYAFAGLVDDQFEPGWVDYEHFLSACGVRVKAVA